MVAYGCNQCKVAGLSQQADARIGPDREEFRFMIGEDARAAAPRILPS